VLWIYRKEDEGKVRIDEEEEVDDKKMKNFVKMEFFIWQRESQ
jgi:hypothetical protein